MTPRAPHLLLLHGFAQSSASWSGVEAELSGRLQATALDLFAGRTQAELTPLKLRERLAATIVELGEPVALWGYSLGGRVAFDLALSRPELVDSLVIESALPGIADERERNERLAADAQLAERIERWTVEQFVEFWEELSALGTQSAELKASQRADRLAQDPQILAEVLRRFGQGSFAPLWVRLGEFKQPTLLLSGAEDARYTQKVATVAELMPDARQVVVPGAAHAVHLSDPAAAAAAVLEHCLQQR